MLTLPLQQPAGPRAAASPSPSHAGESRSAPGLYILASTEATVTVTGRAGLSARTVTVPFDDGNLNL